MYPSEDQFDDFKVAEELLDTENVIANTIVAKELTEVEQYKEEVLDEINRVDISRVFGELFTAMEASYRDKGVELSVNIKDIDQNEKKGLHIKKDKLYSSTVLIILEISVNFSSVFW